MNFLLSQGLSILRIVSMVTISPSLAKPEGHLQCSLYVVLVIKSLSYGESRHLVQTKLNLWPSHPYSKWNDAVSFTFINNLYPQV